MIDAGRLSQEDADAILEQAEAVGNSSNKFPSWMLKTPDALIEAAVVQSKIEAATNERSQLAPPMRVDVDARLEGLNNELLAIRNKAADELVVKETETIQGIVGKENVTVYNSKAEMEAAGLSDLDMNSDGFIEVDGKIEHNGVDVTDLECYERSRNGFFIAHQSPPTLDGVNTLSLFSEFAKFDAPDARKIEIIRKSKSVFNEMSLPEDWSQRDFNHGASGGERKKNELAQAMLKTPALLLLDEPDSGLEQASRSKVTDLIKEVCDNGGIVLLVTHDQQLQDSYLTKKIELSNGQTL